MGCIFLICTENERNPKSPIANKTNPGNVGLPPEGTMPKMGKHLFLYEYRN